MKKIVIVVILASVILTTAVAMAGCSDRVVLNVFNWGEYIDESLIDRFEDETGIKVNYKTYDTNETLLAKLEAGGVSYDVVFPSDYAISEMIKSDMLLPIDFSNVPNFRYIDERFKNREYDPENMYSVPYFWGTIGILYNRNMVDDPVDSWNILWNEKYKGKILMKKDVRDSMGIALKVLGYSMNSTNDAELQEAKELLVRQKDLINGYYGDEIKDMIANGDAAMGVTYSGDFMDLYWDESTDFSYIGYGVPKEGTNLWFDAMVIPKGSKHKAEAEMFINFMLDPEIAFQNSNEVGYTSPNTEALQRMREESPEVFELPAYWPDDSIVQLSEVYIDLGEYKTIYNQIWMEVRIE
ncbi:MAG: spermidine/putrescine ABC transporter substrate-binding protein [Clostridia bacterium]